MPFPRRAFAIAVLTVVGVVVVLTPILWFVILAMTDQARSHRQASVETDEAIVSESEAAATEALRKNAEANPAVLNKLGRFRKLTRTSIADRRPHYAWQLAPSLSLLRTAEYEKGSLPVIITVVTGEGDVHVESIEYLPAGPDPWQKVPIAKSRIGVNVRHPRFR